MKPLNFREQDFKREVEKQPYSKQIRDEFFEYWSEPDRAQSPKMRFEKEKTWDLGRRLARWARKNNEGKAAIKVFQPEIIKEPTNEIEELDLVLKQYSKDSATVNFIGLAKYYNFLVDNKLMKSFTKEEVKIIRDSYGDDRTRCRAACVAETLKSYHHHDINFSAIIKMREKLNGSNQTGVKAG